MTTMLYTAIRPVSSTIPGASGHPERPARLEGGPGGPRRPGSLRGPRAPRGAPGRAGADRPGAPPRLSSTGPEAIPAAGYHGLDMDTVVSPGSGEAALRAAGALCAAVDAVMAGEADNAFCAVRPPGHHAEPERAMGFCLFNNVAIGAAQARAAHGLSGSPWSISTFTTATAPRPCSGTRRSCSSARPIRCRSIRAPAAPSERGASGTNIVNAPLPPGAGSPEFRACHERGRLAGAAPLRAGVHPGLRRLRCPCRPIPGPAQVPTRTTTPGRPRSSCSVAAECCAGRLVSTLEGGYDLNALAASAAAHVRP